MFNFFKNKLELPTEKLEDKLIKFKATNRNLSIDLPNEYRIGIRDIFTGQKVKVHRDFINETIDKLIEAQVILESNIKIHKDNEITKIKNKLNVLRGEPYNNGEFYELNDFEVRIGGDSIVSGHYIYITRQSNYNCISIHQGETVNIFESSQVDWLIESLQEAYRIGELNKEIYKQIEIRDLEIKLKRLENE